MSITEKMIRDQQIIAGYLHDASNIEGAAEMLFRPTTTEEVAEIVQYCQQQNIPLTVSAQRTSTTGGPIPPEGALLSIENLNTIFSDTEVGAGVILGEYQHLLEKKGLLFPPDPTSRNECTVGGAIACNASGARSFRYGAMRPWIEKLEVVLPSSEIIIVDRNSLIPADWPKIDWEPPKVKTAAGFEPADNLLDLMIGQEGTLGIITKAWLKIIPQPREVMGLIALFPNEEACLNFVFRAKKGAKRPDQEMEEGALNPRAIEFFDHNALNLIRQRVDDIPNEAYCGLFLEIEYEEDPNLEVWVEALEELGALVDDIILATDDESRERLYEMRHAIPAGVNEIVVANGMPKIGTDFAVPDQHLSEIMEAYDCVEMEHVLFGHIGDNHLHLNFLPKTADELSYAKEMYRELALMAVDFGGTVSAEHGIGRIKKQLLAEMIGAETLASFQALKNHLDPNWILGRGILFSAKTEKIQ